MEDSNPWAWVFFMSFTFIAEFVSFYIFMNKLKTVALPNTPQKISQPYKTGKKLYYFVLMKKKGDFKHLHRTVMRFSAKYYRNATQQTEVESDPRL